MKPIALLLAAILLVSGVVSVQAASTATQSLCGAAGLIAPTGDFADAVGTGWFAGAGYNYRFNAGWAAGVDLDYFSFGDKSVSQTRIGGTWTDKQSAYGGQSQFYAKYFIPMNDARFEPYVKGGYFHYRIGLKNTVTYRGTTTSSTDKEMKPGFGVGVGASMKLDEKSRIGLEALYSQIETSGKAADLWQVGLNYWYRIGK